MKKHVKNSIFAHFERERLNDIFREAVRYPVISVRAGAGFGKTVAVQDFAETFNALTVWMRLSAQDNVTSRFWDNFVHTVAQDNPPLAKACSKLCFPNTREKQIQYAEMMREYVPKSQRLIILDDFHCIEDPLILRFLEECIVHKMPFGTTFILISRSTIKINTASLEAKGMLFSINENDLKFTENELSRYFREMGIAPQPENLRDIMEDTHGWAFAINIIARSYQKAPGYGGYIRSAMKANIFQLIEAEVWDEIPEKLQNFIIRLSLINHLSFELISLLAENDDGLISGLEKQSAYVHRDIHINAFVIHPLFLEFVSERQSLLSENEKKKTYETAALWCAKNGYRTDALTYYEKTGDYESIVKILRELPVQIPQDIAQYSAEILEQADEKVFDNTEGLAVMHLRVLLCQGLWQKTAEKAEFYEKKYLMLPDNDPFRKRTLSGLYYTWAFLRGLVCVMDDVYDFDKYFEKYCGCISKPAPQTTTFGNRNPGAWINCAGAARKGAPDEYIEALGRSFSHLSRAFDAVKTGTEELVRGELLFFRGDTRGAESLVTRALDRSRESKQYDVIHRALFYLLRIAVSQGDYPKAERAVRDMKALLDYNEYLNRHLNFDIYLSWYYYLLGLPEKMSDWFKEGFSPYSHAGFVENFTNQIKARFCYTTKNFPPLLSYINEMKMRESVLFGRVEMLAIEACVHYKMKDREKAFSALTEAYNAASPNEIFMPFIELGKDMRTLSAAAAKEKSKIPGPWLENINRKAASYAKQQGHVAAEYKRINGIADTPISPRETEVLLDLSRGLSHAEIAASRDLSINTVKMVINNIYAKLGAENLASLIRIAVERKLI